MDMRFLGGVAEILLWDLNSTFRIIQDEVTSRIQ